MKWTHHYCSRTIKTRLTSGWYDTVFLFSFHVHTHTQNVMQRLHDGFSIVDSCHMSKSRVHGANLIHNSRCTLSSSSSSSSLCQSFAKSKPSLTTFEKLNINLCVVRKRRVYDGVCVCCVCNSRLSTFLWCFYEGARASVCVLHKICSVINI